MNNIKLIFYFILCITFASAIDFETEDDVYLLTEYDYDIFMDQNPFVMVAFYAPWCKFSQRLLPYFKTAAKKLKTANLATKLALVDATVEVKLAKRFNVSEYPIIYFKKIDRMIHYKGSHHAQRIFDWIIGKTDNLILKFNNINEYETEKQKFNVIVSIPESVINDVFIRNIEKINDVQFVSLPNEIYNNIFADSNMVLWRKEDNKLVQYKGSVSNIADMEDFILRNEIPLVNKYSNSIGNKIFGNPKKKEHLIVFASEKFEEIKTNLTQVAEENQNISFVLIDVAEDVAKSMSSFFKITIDKPPKILLSNVASKVVFFPTFSEVEFGVDGTKVADFLQDVQQGRVKPYLKSEQVPADWDKKPVKVLVGKNFEQVAYDKSKHVFVKFYVPWCPHCKDLAPVWERLAKTLEPVSDLVIAKIDMSANDIKDLNIQSYPKLKLFTKDSNEIVDFKGMRTVKMFKEFLSKYVSIPEDKTEL